MVKRQVAEEHVALADLGQGEPAAETLGDDVTMGEEDALGPPGGARGVHDRGDVAGPDRGGPRGPRRLVHARALVHHLIEGEETVPLGARPREDHHLLEVGQERERGQHLPELLLVGDEQQARLRVLEHVDDLLGDGVRRERVVHDPRGEAGEVAERRLEAVLREDRHRDALAPQRQDPAGERPGAPGDVGHRELRGLRPQEPHGHGLRLGLLTRAQDITHGDVRPVHRREEDGEPGVDLPGAELAGEEPPPDGVQQGEHHPARRLARGAGEVREDHVQEHGHRGQVLGPDAAEGLACLGEELRVRGSGRPADGQAGERGLWFHLEHGFPSRTARRRSTNHRSTLLATTRRARSLGGASHGPMAPTAPAPVVQARTTAAPAPRGA